MLSVANAARTPGAGLSTSLGSLARTVVVMTVAGIVAGGCGGSDGNSSPPPPVSVIQTPDGLADVGSQVRLDASESSDPTGQGLGYFWTLLRPPDSNTFYQDHCGDSPDVVCTMNDDTTCEEDEEIPCETDADCAEVGGECDRDSGTMSSQCPDEGPCDVGQGQQMVFATFIADVPGPFTVRLLTQATNDANDVGTRVIRTNPSLFLVGSLLEFGGTQGGFVGISADAEIFAPGARAGTASTLDGNILLAATSPPVIREFDFRTGKVIGTFGETVQFSDIAVAMTFDEVGTLWVAYQTGIVRRFDGRNGLFIDEFADVEGPGQGLSAIAISPDTGNLLVADPTLNAGIRQYARVNGAFLGVLGGTATAVSRATDLAFQGDPALDLLISDAIDDVIRCDPDGDNCASFGVAASVLAGGVPSAIAVNPSSIAGDAAVVIAAPGNATVVACSADGSVCADDFGDTGGFSLSYSDIVFAPTGGPTTTTTTLVAPSTSTTISTTSETSTTTVSTMTTSSTSTTSTTIATSSTMPPPTTVTSSTLSTTTSSLTVTTSP